MFNPVQLMDAVATCIAERTVFDCKSYVICWHEGRFKCLPAKAVKNDGNIFLKISAADCSMGLTLEQWAACQKKAAYFFENLKPDSVTHLSSPAAVAGPGRNAKKRGK